MLTTSSTEHQLRFIMATSTILQYFFLLCLLLFSVSPTLSNDEFPETGFITLPVKKDLATLQYYTSIGIGTPQNNMNLAIDLSGKFLWYDCDTHYDSSSYLPVPCDSQTCPQNSPCTECNGFPPKPGCTNNTCGLSITNPFVDTVFAGDMGEDLLHMSPITVPRSFVSGCADSDRFTTPLLSGLADGTKGILGLGRSHLSLSNQISSSYNVPPKFTLCLPSETEGTGKIFITRRPFSPDPVTQIGLSANSKDEYFINVNSIDVDGKVVTLNHTLLVLDESGNGGTKISTMTPYTVLHHSIHKPLVRDFARKALAKGIKRVQSVKPYAACFDANTIGKSDGGPDVPSINLAFDGRFGQVKYDILGHNSMVEVEENVLCLALVNGGKKAKHGIVLGGHQLEDRIWEFDLSTSILSFGPSLLLHGATCSDADPASSKKIFSFSS